MLVEEAKRRPRNMSPAAPRSPSRRSRQAERDAVNEVRASAVDIAVEAARKLLGDKVDAKAGAELFKSSLRGSEGQAELSRYCRRFDKPPASRRLVLIGRRLRFGLPQCLHRSAAKRSTVPTWRQRASTAVDQHVRIALAVSASSRNGAKDRRCRRGAAARGRRSPRGGARSRSPYAPRSRSWTGPAAALHHAVAHHLGDDRGGGDRLRALVALDQRPAVAGQAGRHVAAVGQRQQRLSRQAAERRAASLPGWRAGC